VRDLASGNGRRVIIVTGGSSGIGAATAAAFSAEDELVATLDTAPGPGDYDLELVCDVSDEGAVEAAVAEVVERLGPVGVLACCAGVSLPGTVADTDVAAWDATFGVNVRGTFLCSRAVIPGMRANGGGAIVTVASQLGIVAAPASAAYCASKGAVIQLTRSMALDHAGEGIRANCVCPGPTDTPMLGRRLARGDDEEAERRRYDELLPGGRLVEPEEIAAGIQYLASPAAASTVGATLVIDGGYTVQ